MYKRYYKKYKKYKSLYKIGGSEGDLDDFSDDDLDYFSDDGSIDDGSIDDDDIHITVNFDSNVKNTLPWTGARNFFEMYNNRNETVELFRKKLEDTIKGTVVIQLGDGTVLDYKKPLNDYLKPDDDKLQIFLSFKNRIVPVVCLLDDREVSLAEQFILSDKHTVQNVVDLIEYEAESYIVDHNPEADLETLRNRIQRGTLFYIDMSGDEILITNLDTFLIDYLSSGQVKLCIHLNSSEPWEPEHDSYDQSYSDFLAGLEREPVEIENVDVDYQDYPDVG